MRYKMVLEKKIRVCIRGMSGLLGSRLALAIKKQNDMIVTVGISKNDKSLNRILNGMLSREDLPKEMYLDEPHKVVNEVNASQSLVKFKPTDQLNLKTVCDIVVDATSPGTRGDKWDEKYSSIRRIS
jgi:dihydrodipicolinate reductase